MGGSGDGAESVTFDRIADRYDETRGGLRRGRELAEAMEPYVGDARRLFEVGVGTGVMAAAFAERGRVAVGVDLSSAMLERAQAKVGPRVALADGHQLPVGNGRLDAVYIVWVLHLVAYPGTVVAECARVLRRGGRLLVVAGRPRTHGSDVAGLFAPLDELRSKRLRPDTAANVQSWAADAGLDMVDAIETDELFTQTPAEAAQQIEDRVFSFLWDVDELAWTRLVRPVIANIRALPDPDRPRTVRQRRDIHVFAR